MTNIFLFSIAGLIIGIVFGFIIAMVIYRRERKTVLKSVFNAYKSIESSSSNIKSGEPVPTVLEEKVWFEEEISFIFHLIENISLSLDRDKIAEQIAQEVNNFLNTERCVIILEEENEGVFKIRYAIGLDPDTAPSLLLKKGESISGWVIQNNEPLLVNDLDNWPWYKQINREGYFKRHLISVPFSAEKKAFGVINVCDKKTGQVFSEEDLRFLISVARMGTIAFQNIQLREQMQENYLKTITTLAAAIDAKDPYTKTHSENVTRFAVAIARQMNCSFAEIETIRRAGLLHDIGKIGIKDEILLKPAKLNQEEFQQVKFHPEKGERMLSSLPFLKEASVLIRHHHERYDGRGYPDGIGGHKIERGARILALADSFDAMISDRPYRKRLSLEECINELNRNRGTQFDHEVVDCFLKILEQNPDIIFER